MKRGPQPAQDEQQLQKHRGDETFTSGPLAATLTWNDFWLEVLKYFTSWNIWKLSCISKSLHALAWSLLIPNFEGGLNFKLGDSVGAELPVETYLSRVKSLKFLELPNKFAKPDTKGPTNVLAPSE